MPYMTGEPKRPAIGGSFAKCNSFFRRLVPRSFFTAPLHATNFSKTHCLLMDNSNVARPTSVVECWLNESPDYTLNNSLSVVGASRNICFAFYGFQLMCLVPKDGLSMTCCPSWWSLLWDGLHVVSFNARYGKSWKSNCCWCFLFS